MNQIIRFAEIDVDGCGTNVDVTVVIQADFSLTHGHQTRLKDEIQMLKQTLSKEEWDTDHVVNLAMEAVFGSTGYQWQIIVPDLYVDF